MHHNGGYKTQSSKRDDNILTGGSSQYCSVISATSAAVTDTSTTSVVSSYTAHQYIHCHSLSLLFVPYPPCFCGHCYPLSRICICLYSSELPSSSKNPHFLCCRVLSSGPPTAIIHKIYHNLCLPSVYLVFLHIRYISTRRHCLYIPVISANHFPHHCVISPVIVCVSLCQGGTLFQATARLRKPPYLLSHISYVSLLDVPRLHRFCLPISTSPLSLLYHIFDGAYINRNFCCFPCLI